MRLFNLIKQHDTVGLAAHGLSKLTALVITHISRRRTNESRHAVALLILTHIYTHHHILIVKHHLCQGLGQLGLTHAGGTQEDETAYRTAAVT